MKASVIKRACEEALKKKYDFLKEEGAYLYENDLPYRQRFEVTNILIAIDVSDWEYIMLDEKEIDIIKDYL